MNNLTANTLADTFECVRNLTKFYFSKLDDSQYMTEHKIDNVDINNAYWLFAHLVWTEHSLIIQGIADQDMEIDWLEKFAYDSDPKSIESPPSLEEIQKQSELVHLKAMEIIRGLSDEDLEKDNYFNFTIGGSKSKKTLIMHAIRHEPMHIGQLSLILKANNVKLG